MFSALHRNIGAAHSLRADVQMWGADVVQMCCATPGARRCGGCFPYPYAGDFDQEKDL